MSWTKLKAAREHAGEQPDIGSLGESITVRLRRVDRQLAAAFDRAEGDALPGSLAALALISANPGISQTDITTATGVHKSTVVALIDGLESAGQAERRASLTDRRRHALYATSKGEADLAAAVNIIKNIEAQMLSALSPGELEVLCTLLDRMNASCLNATRDFEAADTRLPQDYTAAAN